MKLYPYKREDGTQCEAVKFEGYVEGGAEHIFNITQLLRTAEFTPYWVPAEKIDQWVENEEGDGYDQVVIPEHIKTVNDMLKVGDYLVKRDGDLYVMDGALFDSIYDSVEVTPIKVSTCKYCRKAISNVADDGTFWKTYMHLEGVQKGLRYCWPADTGKPYGLEAEPTLELSI